MQLSNFLLLFRFSGQSFLRLLIFSLCLSSSITARSDKSCSPPPDKYDLIESDVEIVERYDEPKLEETCVLVEAEKLHVPQGSVKRKSYKVPSPSPSSRVVFSYVFLFINIFIISLVVGGRGRGCFIEECVPLDVDSSVVLSEEAQASVFYEKEVDENRV